MASDHHVSKAATRSAPPADASEAPPGDLEADFAPLKQDDEPDSGDSDPYMRDSLLAQEVFDRATTEANANQEQEAVARFLQAAKIAERAREWYLAGLALEQVGNFLQDPKPPSDLERAFRIYRRAVAAYEACGHFAKARRLSYRMMCLKMRHARELSLRWRARVELALYWALAGFGYRPLRILGVALVLILAYAVVYWLSGGIASPAGIDSAAGTASASFLDAVYFSGITFATVGYGDLVPAPAMRLVALTEGALGLFTMSFFVVVLANRLRH